MGQGGGDARRKPRCTDATAHRYLAFGIMLVIGLRYSEALTTYLSRFTADFLQMRFALWNYEWVTTNLQRRLL